MKSIELISRILLTSTVKQKLPKAKKDYLIAALALAALPEKVFATNETPEKS